MIRLHPAPIFVGIVMLIVLAACGGSGNKADPKSIAGQRAAKSAAATAEPPPTIAPTVASDPTPEPITAAPMAASKPVEASDSAFWAVIAAAAPWAILGVLQVAFMGVALIPNPTATRRGVLVMLIGLVASLATVLGAFIAPGIASFIGSTLVIVFGAVAGSFALGRIPAGWVSTSTAGA